MGPPPPPLSTPAQQPPKESQDFVHEKYRKLKRRYFELEEVNFKKKTNQKIPSLRHPTETQGSAVRTQTI